LSPVTNKIEPDEREADDPVDKEIAPLARPPEGLADRILTLRSPRISTPPRLRSPIDPSLSPELRCNDPLVSMPSPPLTNTAPEELPWPADVPTDSVISPDEPSDDWPDRIKIVPDLPRMDEPVDMLTTPDDEDSSDGDALLINTDPDPSNEEPTPLVSDI
jgi:hypothetical protein